MKKYYLGLAILALLAAPWAAPLSAQEVHGGGGGGCGDVFGDLIHILRDEVTGQSILARRYVELPAEVPGYGWGYCAIGVTAGGAEIPFLPYSCDLDLDPDANGFEELSPVELDYFGRLSGGRTKEKNHRMHFNEVIANIKMSGAVQAEPATGRLMMGYDCKNGKCEDWSVVDSPMESMALYTRLMKYGHLQTDPQEHDVWVHGDPAAIPPFNPALDPDDWAKFDKQSLSHLLPFEGEESCFADDFPEGGNGVYDPPEAYVDEDGNGFYDDSEPFDDVNENGVRDSGDSFDPDCAAPLSLDEEDFSRAGTFLGAAANKTGRITVDLVQYTNRILKIPVATHTTDAAPDTLPALVRDCEDPTVDYQEPDESDLDPEDPPYLDLASCSLYEAHDGLPNYEYFPDVRERFVDFAGLEVYRRSEWRKGKFEELILPDRDEGAEPTVWYLSEGVRVLDWLEFANGPEPKSKDAPWNIQGFVASASDALRTIEFVHNYAVPLYLPPFAE